MIGPILIAISWILFKLEGKGLGAIGFNAPRTRLQQFAVGFFMAGAVAALQQLGYSWLAGIPWKLNTSFDTVLLLEHLRWNTNSVLFEELLFRGYLLYQAIRWFGTRRGVLLDAAAFGVYHWFSYGLLGNPVMMGFVFMFTGAFGFMLALSFAKTESIAAPIGLHLGWNLVSYLIFSTGPLGPALLIPGGAATEIAVSGLVGIFLSIGLPLVLVVTVSWYLVRHPQNTANPDPGLETSAA